MTHNLQAASIFRARYKGARNVMTPRVSDYRIIAKGALAVELSSGDNMNIGAPDIWGVTVLVVAEPDQRHELNRLCFSRGEAESYIKSLRPWRAGVTS